MISALHYEWEGMAQCMARARDEFGVDGVELSWHKSHARPHCTKADFAWLVENRDQHGLDLYAHIWEDLAQLGSGPAEEALLGWLERCVETRTFGLIIHGGTHDDQRAGIAITREVLANVLPDYEHAGVVLNLENHYAYDYKDCRELFSEPWEFLEVMNLESPSLRFCFDTGHAHMTRNGEALLNELASYLHHIHLADNMGEHDDHMMYRQGTVPWDTYFDVMQRNEFDATICVEYPVRDDLAPFRLCQEQLRERWSV
jgi:sugar phosphate isomerase/epimerase